MASTFYSTAWGYFSLAYSVTQEYLCSTELTLGEVNSKVSISQSVKEFSQQLNMSFPACTIQHYRSSIYASQPSSPEITSVENSRHFFYAKWHDSILKQPIGGYKRQQMPGQWYLPIVYSYISYDQSYQYSHPPWEWGKSQF